VARTIVLNQLSMTAKSRAQLETALAKREVPPDIAAAVLDRMTEVGLVDDAAYAHEWVRQRQQGKGLARRALADELRRKGIADDLVQDALATVDDQTERASAFELTLRKARSSRGHPHDKRMRSLAGMLARKGYSSTVAFSVVREVLALEGTDVDDALY
jgi:regulatory protein